MENKDQNSTKTAETDAKSAATPLPSSAQQTSLEQQFGDAVQRARNEKGWTQDDLAQIVGTSQSAVARIEKGEPSASLEQVAKYSQALGRRLVSINDPVTQSYRIEGGRKLTGSITINTSKNAAVSLLCASLLNHGITTLKNIARIEEVFRIIEVLESIGVLCLWNDAQTDLTIIPPARYDLSKMNVAAARRTRSILLLMAPLLWQCDRFRLPFAGGCSLGKRSVTPHLKALQHFGLDVTATSDGFYAAKVNKTLRADARPRKIVLIERGDTVTENAVMAAALSPAETTIIGASPNYMVQDLCFFLEKLGVKIQGIGTTTLKITGVADICTNVDYAPAEDPIEAMSFIAAALVTKSEITIKRAPIEFLEIELELLRSMHAKFTLSPEYFSHNGRTRLVDIQVRRAHLVAPSDKIHPMPFPGLNIDNLPFFSVVAATAEGRTLIHDWVFENRAVYITELSNLNARVELLDAHRVYVEGPTRWRPAELVAPAALRPAVVIMVAMLAAPGTSILRNIYSIARGYQDFATRLNSVGAEITPLSGI